MRPNHRHTHCQATQANALTQDWQRVWLTNRKTEKLTDEEEHRTDNSTYTQAGGIRAS
ncbi:MAG: hypothetical protein WCJ61_07345 [Paludibacter sp.]